ncbi:hypothetical protein ACI1US_01844 [Leucobacter sp. BZR 635]
MSKLRATLVDPRYVTEEDHSPVYRVDFWDAQRASSEHRIEGAESVHEVLEWAEAHRQGRYVVVWAEYARAGGAGLTRLAGWEPNHPESPSWADPTFRQ